MKRYSSKPFPVYPYVPTLLPHPRENPLGHSYGKIDPVLDSQNETILSHGETYLYGVDLFNFGYFWECHEAWEKIWLTLKKEAKYHLFFQGLILVAAGFLKEKMQQSNSAKKLFDTAHHKLAKLNTLLLNQKIIFRLDVLNWMHKLEHHLSKQGEFPFLILK